MIIEDQRHVKRTNAGRHLTAVLSRELDALGARRDVTLQPGELAGFPLTARVERTLNGKVATLELRGAPGTSVVIPASELAAADPAALVTRLQNRLRQARGTQGHHDHRRRARPAGDRARSRRGREGLPPRCRASRSPGASPADRRGTGADGRGRPRDGRRPS